MPLMEYEIIIGISQTRIYTYNISQYVNISQNRYILKFDFYIFFTNIPNINICDRMYNDITMYIDTHEVIVHSFKLWDFMHLNWKIVNESYVHVHIKWWSLEMRAYVYKTWLFTLYLRKELSFKTFWSWIRSLEASRLYISDILI